MFYSADLLRRKTPLGAIWIAAHGKKLARGRIMQVNIPDTCNQIMDPEIPQALRLQAILASGVTIVYSKQSNFLLEDCQQALKRLVGSASTVDETASGTVLQARAADIDMGDTDLLNLPFQVVDISTPHGRALLQDNDDLILMPSIPESQDVQLSGRSPAVPVDQADFFTMETMEVPQLPDGMFDAFEPQFNGEPALNGPNFDNPMDDYVPPPPDYDVEFPPVEEAQPEPAPAPAANRRNRRRKRALVDEPENITIPSQYYHSSQAQEREEVLAEQRGRRGFSIQPKEAADLFSLDPATGKWCDELASIWERCNAASKKPRGILTPAGGAERQKGSKRARVHYEDEPPLDQDQDQLNLQAYLDADHQVQPQHDYYGAPPPMEDYAHIDQEPGAYDAFGRPYVSPAKSDGVDSVEVERLRAALNGTPGANYKDAMFQLGLTPASDDKFVSGGHRGRFSNASLRDSRGGRLSERSSEPGSRRGLAEMLEELGGERPTDLAAGLPTVGEEDGEHEGGLDRSGVSLFSLVEESGPTAPSLPPQEVAEHLHSTLQVLASLRKNADTTELSLDSAVAGLSRIEAARTFSHVLVGYSKDYIGASQKKPFGDITITFKA